MFCADLKIGHNELTMIVIEIILNATAVD